MKRLFLILCLLLWSSQAWGAIAIDAVSTGSGNQSGAGYSFTHVTGSDPNMLLTCAAASGNSSSENFTITYNGTTLTKGRDIDFGDNAQLEQHYLSTNMGLSSGSHSVVVTGSQTGSGVICVTFSGVDQAVLYDTYGDAHQGGTTSSITETGIELTGDGNWGVSWFAGTQASNPLNNLAPADGATNVAGTPITDSGSSLSIGFSVVTGTKSSMSWTFDSGFTFAHLSTAELVAATGGGGSNAAGAVSRRRTQ